MWFLDRKEFLTTWKDIPANNEVQNVIYNVQLTADQIQSKLEHNNVFTIARRQVNPQVMRERERERERAGAKSTCSLLQELLYLSLKFSNNLWVLAELKVTPGDTSLGVRTSIS